MNKFKMSIPKNMDELKIALKSSTEETRLLAGGTDIVVALNGRTISPDLIIDMSGVKEMKYIKEDEENLLIGPLTTFTELEENELVNKYANCLVEAAKDLGSKQIRNRGTIGGNIGNASPAGDSIPALIALESKLDVMNCQGEIVEKSIVDILHKPNETLLDCNQVIIAIKIPKQKEDWISTFVKMGSRKAVTIAKLNIALNVNYNEEKNLINDAKIALGCAGGCAFRPTRMEDLLKGKNINRDLVENFIEGMSVEIEDAIPGRASLPYKREAIKDVAYKAFENLFDGEIIKK